MATEQETNFQVFVRIKPFSPPTQLSAKENECANVGTEETNSSSKSSNTGSAGNVSSPTNNSRLGQGNPMTIRSGGRKAYDAVRHDGQTIQLIDNDFRCIDKRERYYQFNAIFGQKATNEDVFKVAVAPKLGGVLEGINTTIMAYGITGAGKTHTIFGESAANYIQKGVCTYTIDSLLTKMKESDGSKKFDLYFSYLEIYNEQVVDLLNETYKVLQVLDDSQKGSLYMLI